MNEKIRLNYYDTSGRLVSVPFFLGKLKTPKRHFKINWPLAEGITQDQTNNPSMKCMNSPDVCNTFGGSAAWWKVKISGGASISSNRKVVVFFSGAHNWGCQWPTLFHLVPLSPGSDGSSQCAIRVAEQEQSTTWARGNKDPNIIIHDSPLANLVNSSSR